ncbi:Adenylate kinase/UMP-CMP kinase like protein [Aduncisulcus paluster]|uniref:Adenylate kinase/UMP-CMP kinase like protein n=1 Tax=Aduncisulcus paluster TaxID=2918883 RepID=A0ABQ5K5E2_9EUKA|nr:Adenylate kinase/UMP-CMP kinase like protein [Aduncisulcus paluster]
MEYLESKKIFPLFSSIIQDLVIEKPEDHLSFIQERLADNNPPKLIITGPSASGKGRIAKMIVEKYHNVVHISSSVVLQKAIDQGTDLGKRAKEFQSNGELVPDSIIIPLVLEALKTKECRQRGWLLDGFPRNSRQAIALKHAGFIANKMIFIDVPDEDLVHRAEHRLYDVDTGAVYSQIYEPHKPPKSIDSDRLVHRELDKPEPFKRRVRVFRRLMKGVADEFKYIMRSVDGTYSVDDLWDNVLEILKQAPPPIVEEDLTKPETTLSDKFVGGAHGDEKW